MKNTLLSIVIVSYNTKQFLKNCLGSLHKNYSQEIKDEIYEIIVVDNNSKDGSLDMVKNDFKSTFHIENHKNLGFAKANNIGIKKTKGEYILLLNPDTIVSKSVLPQMTSFMEKNHDVGVSTCRVNLESGELDDASHRGFPTPWRAFCHFSGLSKLFSHSTVFNGYHLGYKNLDKIHEIDACCGAFMIIRKSVGRKIDWLDEDYFWYGEDLDFCFRVKEEGWKVMFVPDVKITHFKGVASGIKKHSEHLSLADKKTKLKATKARFEVMKIFYNKHYRNVYPRILTMTVLLGVDIAYFIARRKL